MGWGDPGRFLEGEALRALHKDESVQGEHGMGIGRAPGAAWKVRPSAPSAPAMRQRAAYSPLTPHVLTT